MSCSEGGGHLGEVLRMAYWGLLRDYKRWYGEDNVSSRRRRMRVEVNMKRTEGMGGEVVLSVHIL